MELELPVVSDLVVGHQGLSVALVGGAGASIVLRQVHEPASVTEQLEAVGLDAGSAQLGVDIASIGCDSWASC